MMFRRTEKAACSLALAASLVWSATAFADSRGLSVDFRTAETPEAPIAETVQLYSSSHALVIGIDEYTAGWPRLSKAVEDAREVAAALEGKGFEVTLKTDLGADQLKQTLEEFFVVKGADPESRLFVWFAGHGHTEGGEGFLVPADAGRPDEDPRFRLQALTMRRFGEFVRLARSKHVFSIFDSCFSGTVFDTQRSYVPAAITHATALPVRQFLTSGDAGQLVSDDGTFRELFLRALDGGERADSNNDGYITATELGLHMSNRVTNLTNGRQTPRYGKLRDKDYDRGDFVFAALPSADAAPVPNRPVSSEVANRIVREDMELEFWRTIRESENVEDLEAYLTRYPDGTFAELAENKIVALNTRAIRLNTEPQSAPAPAEQTPQVSQVPAPVPEPQTPAPAPQAVPAAVPAPAPVPGADYFNGRWQGVVTIDRATLVYPACVRAFQSGADVAFSISGGRLAGELETNGAFSVKVPMQTALDDAGRFVANTASAQTRTGLGYSIQIRGNLATGNGTWTEARHRCRGTVTFSRVN